MKLLRAGLDGALADGAVVVVGPEPRWATPGEAEGLSPRAAARRPGAARRATAAMRARRWRRRGPGRSSVITPWCASDEVAPG
jgi:hypothetical protein